MCGIAGWLDTSAASHQEDVSAMLSVVHHRGPNGQGVYSARGVTLGHRRLSILDLSDRGVQPMTRDKVTVTFNGEIYNYIELRSALESAGHRFNSGTDTEVLLASYLHWGTNAVSRFDGMWAFAIHDQRTNQLFLSRDRFGEKPLVYARTRSGLAFASEPRQLRAVGFGGEPDLAAVREMIAVGGKASVESTYFSGISNVRPATNMIINCSTLKAQEVEYYRAGHASIFTGIKSTEVPEVFAAEFERSIRARLRSDVTVGTLLSGGIDSSLIASFAGRLQLEETGKPLIAITAASTDASNDESEWASAVAEDIGLQWKPVRASAKFGIDEWALATAVVEQPLASSSVVMQMDVMREAKRLGVTVLLDGQGADESWLGYPRYAASALEGLSLTQRISFIRKSADRTGLGLPSWFLYYAYFKNPNVAALRARQRNRRVGIEFNGSWYKERFRELSGTSKANVRETQQSQLQGEKLSSLLRYADRTSMHYSIEDRLPFLDHRLVELSLGVPNNVKFHEGWTKWALRQELATRVRPTVAWRKRKIGFEPGRDSFDARATETTNAICRSEILRELGLPRWDLGRANSTILWRLFAIALWEDSCFESHGIGTGTRLGTAHA